MNIPETKDFNHLKKVIKTIEHINSFKLTSHTYKSIQKKYDGKTWIKPVISLFQDLHKIPLSIIKQDKKIWKPVLDSAGPAEEENPEKLFIFIKDIIIKIEQEIWKYIRLYEMETVLLEYMGWFKLNLRDMQQAWDIIYKIIDDNYFSSYPFIIHQDKYSDSYFEGKILGSLGVPYEFYASGPLANKVATVKYISNWKTLGNPKYPICMDSDPSLLTYKIAFSFILARKLIIFSKFDI